MKPVKIALIFIWAVVATSANLLAEEVPFLKPTELNEALQRARNENKNILLDFWATYCTSCRMLDEYVFSHQNVQDELRNYIPVKVDILDFVGDDIKNQYDVKLLPTMIILNPKGQVIKREVKSWSVSEMQTFLKTYKSTGMSAPRVSAPAAYPASTANPPKPIYTNPNTGQSANTTANVPANTGINAKKGFTIQLGAYDTREKAIREAKIYDDYLKKDVAVLMPLKTDTDKKYYRIVFGHFNTREAAAAAMRQYNLNGMIRDKAQLANK